MFCLGPLLHNTAAMAGAVAGATLTWNPADKDASVNLTNSNLTAEVTTGGFHNVRATAAKTSGKWYFESLIANNTSAGYDNFAVGFADLTASLTNYIGSDSGGIGFFSTSFVAGTTYVINAFNAGDVVGIALDADNKRVWMSINNVWQGSGDPAAGTNYASSVLTTYYPAIGGHLGMGTAHFTAASLTYSPPSGFAAIG